MQAVHPRTSSQLPWSWRSGMCARASLGSYYFLSNLDELSVGLKIDGHGDNAAASYTHIIVHSPLFFPSHFHHFSPSSTLMSEPQPHTMLSLLFESTGAELPSAAPPFLELCEDDFEGQDLDRRYTNIQSLMLPDGPSLPYRDASTPTLVSSSEFSKSTYSTDLITANSEYSTPVQHVHVVNAQSDHRQIQLPVCISPHLLSVPFQSTPSAIPTDTPANAAPAIQIRKGPIRMKFICPECDRRKYNFGLFYFFRDAQCFFPAFRKKSNMTSHIKTHNPNRIRRFVCPESDCAYPFTRSHDLRRHLALKHGDLAK